MTQTEITVWPRGRGADPVIFNLLNDSRFQDADKAKVALVLQNLLQAEFEVSQPVKDLPDDDEDKIVDPEPVYGERMFWRGKGSKKELVSRSWIMTVAWDGEQFIMVKRRPR